MRRLLPADAPREDDLDRAYDDPARRAAGRPWLMANMVASIDGAIAVDGTSGALGGDGDRRAFASIRAHADVVLVGAGTVRAERYRGPSIEPEVLERRARSGADEPLRIAVVSRSLELDTTIPMFSPTAASRPLVITVAAADPTRRAELARVADVITAGDDRVDLVVALAALGDRGAQVVLSEGGPSLNGALLEKGLIDELCLTVSPHLVGGNARGIVGTQVRADLRAYRPVQALFSDEHELLLRYVRGD